ncbi:MAG TPA: response regulator [Pirellulaceae bacterium]|jgi:CheY-like chemotaxis protein|nr:response regulator [Pirellulaceae bacterium]
MVAEPVNIVFLEDSETDFELAVHGIRGVAPGVACRRFETRRDLNEYAASGPAAPKLLVIDIRLPDGNGLEAIPTLRSLKQFRNVPIVVFTSSANPEHVRFAHKAGAADYRVKPLDVREYIRTVQEFARTALT